MNMTLHKTILLITSLVLGINSVDINLRAQDEQIRGEFDSRILGLLGYIKFYM